MSSPASERLCSTCQKPESQLQNPLKHCAKCKTQLYCSRGCQKADWNKHKASCGSFASRNSTNPPSINNTEPATANGNDDRAEESLCYKPKPFSALNDGTWLLERPEKDVYKLLVDTYRMGVEDDYKFSGEVEEGSLYSGASSTEALACFRRFLTKATRIDDKRAKKLLPDWWSQSKLKECVGFARRNDWSNIGYAVEKHDIQEHYKENLMPMQLRMFREKLDGTKPGGMSGAGMLNMQVQAEQGNMSGMFSHLSL